MSTLVSAYEYDIFISYRHNDNRSGWVTEFVKVLQEELAATIKEPVSVYFDSNPHDGLSETHDVDESLKEKLKCLIFIPIISQTYCDSNSFAWKHEFLPFKKQAQEDGIGLKVKLQNGNVASRILPVRIHAIDHVDQRMLEDELHGKLRSIDFIYHSAGVNRPLTSKDERELNLNKIFYRDQINKVANSVKEIIAGLKHPAEPSKYVSNLTHTEIQPTSKPTYRRAFAFASLAFVLLMVAGWYFYKQPSAKDTAQVDPSVAVVPFGNLSNDPAQDYISDGVMEAILSHLNKIEGLRLTSRTTMMTYKGTKKTIREIADEVGVRFVLEGSVQRVGSTIRINAQLIDGITDEHVWSEYYDRKLSDLLSIQSEVAQQIADKLEVKVKPAAKTNIETLPTKNSEAYDLYLKAIAIMNDSLEQYRILLENAQALDPQFAETYSRLGMYWTVQGIANTSQLTSKEVIQKAEPLFNKALKLNPNDARAHSELAMLNLWHKWDFYAAERELNYAAHLEPSNPFVLDADFKTAMGRFDEAVELNRWKVKTEPNNIYHKINLGFTLYFTAKPEESMMLLDSLAGKADPANPSFNDIGRTYLYMGKYDRAVEITERAIKQGGFFAIRSMAIMAIALTKLGKDERAIQLLNELKLRSATNLIGSPSFYTAMVYAQLGEIDLAFQYLDKSFANHEIEMHWLKVEPPFKPLHQDPRWKVMLDKVGFPE